MIHPNFDPIAYDFTYTVLKAVGDGTAARGQVLTQVKAALVQGSFDQVPQLEAPAKAKKVPFGSNW